MPFAVSGATYVALSALVLYYVLRQRRPAAAPVEDDQDEHLSKLLSQQHAIN